MRRLIAPLCLALAALVLSPPDPAAGQSLPKPASAPQAVPAMPDDLSPEAVDALLSRLTDTEIRALLREELKRRADERAAAEPTAEAQTFASLRDRISGLGTTLRQRLADWAAEIARLGERSDEVADRMARAQHGAGGMIAATLAVALAGVLAAAATAWATRGWRRWLMNPPAGRAPRDQYWDRVARALGLALLQFAPILAFDRATVTAAPLVSDALGPMVDYVWIYQVGVTYSWAFIVVARRAFAADAPALRVAHLSDSAATAIYRLVRHAVLIGAAGWLIAGLAPTLGLGFPPGLATVTLAGTAVAGLLLSAAARNWAALRTALAGLLIGDDEDPGTLTRMVVAAAPVALILYIVFAWAYWVSLWIETTQQHLYGPAGTMVFLLMLPILDRLGLEIIRGAVRSGSATAARFRAAIHGSWRVLVGVLSVFVIAWLWGIDLYDQAKGEGAPRWADTLFDIAVTLLLAQVTWRLILAALHRERRAPSDGGEDAGDDPADAQAASRLETLVPLFRTVLLMVLSAIVGMILLSSLGVNIGPLLASAGIIGIAVGFGAQTLVRDIFSGAFFLVDDAFRVGEYIELDQDLRGEVEAISIRSLQLRHHRGPVITIPFGELKHVVNHNRDWVIYKMSFRLDPDTDPDRVKKLVKEVGKELLAHPEFGQKFLEPLKSQGVSMIDDDSALVIRVKFKCKPRAQFVLRREVFHRLRKTFAQNGLHFARRKVEVVSSTGADHRHAAGALPEDILSGKSGA